MYLRAFWEVYEENTRLHHECVSAIGYFRLQFDMDVKKIAFISGKDDQNVAVDRLSHSLHPYNISLKCSSMIKTTFIMLIFYHIIFI